MRALTRTLAALAVAAGVVAAATVASADALPLIDAHSQLPNPGLADEIIALMDRAGVRTTVLGYRGGGKAKHVAALAVRHPDRILAAVKTKGKKFARNAERFYDHVRKWSADPRFRVLGEVLLYHAAKGDKAPEVSVMPDAPQVEFLLDIAKAKGWPFYVHVEFAALAQLRDTLMARLEAMLAANRDIAFLMMHMGQLGPDEAGRLIAAHANVHFVTSHANPIKTRKSSQPWIDMFAGERLTPAWAALITRHPDRFLFAIDNVWPDDWGRPYLDQVALWRKALAALPPEVAHAVGHGNAERIYGLPPSR